LATLTNKSFAYVQSKMIIIKTSVANFVSTVQCG